MTIRVLSPVGLTGQAERLLELSVQMQACHRVLVAALELADRDPIGVATLLSAAGEAAEWGRQFGERAEWADGHNPFAGHDLLVDGLAAPRAFLGDVGANGAASGWEVPGLSPLWQPWRSFGQHTRQAAAQRGLEWPDDRPPLSTVLGPIGSLLAEVSGVADAKRCIQGSLPDCGWFAAGLVPWGRMARIAHLARFADEAGGVAARAGQEILERRGLTIDVLAAAARVPKKGGLTVAAHSLTKHGRGARPGNRLFPEARGNPAEINETAHRVVDEILHDPESRIVEFESSRFGGTIEVIGHDGRAIRFSDDGEFLHFKE